MGGGALRCCPSWSLWANLDTSLVYLVPELWQSSLVPSLFPVVPKPLLVGLAGLASAAFDTLQSP